MLEVKVYLTLISPIPAGMELVSIRGGSPLEGATQAERMTEKYAVTVRGAHMEYKSFVKSIISKKAEATHVALRNFNMTVQKGHM